MTYLLFPLQGDSDYVGAVSILDFNVTSIVNFGDSSSESLCTQESILPSWEEPERKVAWRNFWSARQFIAFTCGHSGSTNGKHHASQLQHPNPIAKSRIYDVLPYAIHFVVETNRYKQWGVAEAGRTVRRFVSSSLFHNVIALINQHTTSFRYILLAFNLDHQL
ncbi:hypothetical protein BDV93DRAFT_510977 [Ceratobasidium sp. AG-I]|nr:hypothetical protein BDV93DRAFT_510977 [Ceratobasidium sp. AG-I]